MTLEQAKKEHDEWHPVYIEDCLWCRSEVALPSVRAALQASEERELRLRALAKGFRANGIAPVDYHNSTIEEYIARQIERILDGGKP
jgi:hypothetical protein